MNNAVNKLYILKQNTTNEHFFNSCAICILQPNLEVRSLGHLEAAEGLTTNLTISFLLLPLPDDDVS